MLPMVTELGEIAQAREIIDREVRHLSRFAPSCCRPACKLGAMLEVPSLLFQLDELMEAVDFVSVGSNDLFQFVDGGRSRQYAASPIASTRCRRRSCGSCKQIVDAGERNQHAGDAVRRARRQADLGDGADRHRLPLDLDVAGLDRSGQGDADSDSPAGRLQAFLDEALMAGADGSPTAARLLQAFADDRNRSRSNGTCSTDDQPAPRHDGSSSSSVSTMLEARCRPGRRRTSMSSWRRNIPNCRTMVAKIRDAARAPSMSWPISRPCSPTRRPTPRCAILPRSNCRGRGTHRSAGEGHPDPAAAEGCGRRQERDPRNPRRHRRRRGGAVRRRSVPHVRALCRRARLEGRGCCRPATAKSAATRKSSRPSPARASSPS